jgi:acetyltransferase-like isoleucine patch superfamily enzyme
VLTDADRQVSSDADRQVSADADRQVSADADRQVSADADRQVSADADRQVSADADRQAVAQARLVPPPLTGGPIEFLRFAHRSGMLRLPYLPLAARWVWLKLRWRGRLVTDGPCFIRPGVKFEIGPEARVSLGRWSWIGDGTKIRAHEGTVTIGARTVFGQECTLSSFQGIEVGRECIIADRVMMIDFDHRTEDPERPIREQGIYKRDLRVGHNVWIGYGACLLRGVTVGDNAVIGTSAVVTRDVPGNAVVGGVPATVLRMRESPETLRYE